MNTVHSQELMGAENSNYKIAERRFRFTEIKSLVFAIHPTFRIFAGYEFKGSTAGMYLYYACIL